MLAYFIFVMDLYKTNAVITGLKAFRIEKSVFVTIFYVALGSFF